MRALCHRVAVATFLVSALTASIATSQALDLMTSPSRVEVPPVYSPEFGTSSTSIKMISAQSFRLESGTEGQMAYETYLRICDSLLCRFFGELSLPSGSFITGLELEGCDDDPAGNFLGAIVRFPSPVQAGGFVSPVADSGVVPTPGCGLFPVPVAHTVNNLTGHYAIVMNVTSGTNVGFSALRVRYNLQVSPAPLTASFNDVPTGHPQFQFIEALVGAGITAGCGGGNYCPDGGLTRGQMAVFLAKALGLHFPN